MRFPTSRVSSRRRGRQDRPPRPQSRSLPALGLPPEAEGWPIILQLGLAIRQQRVQIGYCYEFRPPLPFLFAPIPAPWASGQWKALYRRPPFALYFSPPRRGGGVLTGQTVLGSSIPFTNHRGCCTPSGVSANYSAPATQCPAVRFRHIPGFTVLNSSSFSWGPATLIGHCRISLQPARTRRTHLFLGRLSSAFSVLGREFPATLSDWLFRSDRLFPGGSANKRHPWLVPLPGFGSLSKGRTQRSAGDSQTPLTRAAGRWAV